MKLLKGKKIADRIIRDLKKKIAKRKIKPTLAVVLIGENKASDVYVSLKQKAAGAIDMNFWVLKFSARDSEKEIIKEIKELNADRDISGIIVQLPLPKKFNTQKIIDAIDPRKDADGFSGQNPVFPQAILKLIEGSGQKLNGKKAIVVVNSKIFGETMCETLKNKKIISEYILSSCLVGRQARIKNQSASWRTRIREADIVITAVGKANLIKGAMLKKGAIVIDGGIVKKGKKVLGDVEFESVSQVAGYLSPVPGGVGPVTIACLLQNTYFLSRM